MLLVGVPAISLTMFLDLRCEQNSDILYDGVSAGESSELLKRGRNVMEAVLERSIVSGQACVACFIVLGSAEQSIQGVRGLKEGPLHYLCASPAEQRIAERAAALSR